MIDAALRFARDGVHVFPCRGKIPITKHGVIDATTNEKQIREWWTKHPDATIGVAAGASGLVVIDIDTKNGADGWAAFDECLQRYGELPATRMASTPSGGAHLYFFAPDGVTIRPSASKLGDGVDVRAGNSYVIAPPSPGYRWDVRAKCAELPQSWVDALQPPKREPGPAPAFGATDSKRVTRYSVKALQAEARNLAAMRSGRNDRLWKSAAALGGLVHLGGISAEDIRIALDWACSTWPDRNPRVDRNTLERGLTFGIEHPREWRDSAAA